jgi:hypothetical protein
MPSAASDAGPHPLAIWLDRPTDLWGHALPGGARLGAMGYGRGSAGGVA